jgi:hypothetical protein
MLITTGTHPNLKMLGGDIPFFGGPGTPWGGVHTVFVGSVNPPCWQRVCNVTFAGSTRPMLYWGLPRNNSSYWAICYPSVGTIYYSNHKTIIAGWHKGLERTANLLAAEEGAWHAGMKMMAQPPGVPWPFTATMVSAFVKRFGKPILKESDEPMSLLDFQAKCATPCLLPWQTKWKERMALLKGIVIRVPFVEKQKHVV